MAEKQEKWYSVSIKAAPEASEAIESALNVLDALGTEINNLRRDQKDDVTVSGYFDSEPDIAEVSAKVDEFLEIYSLDRSAVRSIESSGVENADWLYEWKKHWKPTEAGRFIVTPPWYEVAANGRFVIEIEPAMAFGTGTHDTTRLCLQAIGENYRDGESFLDVGTGTGILAIAAAKMYEGAAIYGCDTDEDSITNARENAEMNGVAERIELEVGPITEATPRYDFVCANLTLDVIAPLLDLLLDKAGRMLILSGILGEQKEEILRDLEMRGIKDAVVRHSGEWISVTIAR